MSGHYGTLIEPAMNPNSNLVLTEQRLRDLLEMDPDQLVRDLGGRPFALVCTTGRMRRYRKMADQYGLMLFENGEMVSREDGCVLIRADEVPKYLPNYKATT